MLWIKAFHIIFVICWFAGLFYLPRLFVYHSLAEDIISKERFKIMERKLYYGIMTPSALLTVVFGGWLISYNFTGYLTSGWMLWKLGLVLILLGYHGYCGRLRRAFAHDKNQYGHRFYRLLNEVPAVILVVIVILVVVKPF